MRHGTTIEGRGARSLGIALVGLQVLCAAGWAQEAAPPPLSDETQACIDCHADATPGIVEDWRRSRHARTTVAQALARPALERRISSEEVPEALREVAVGCYECHGLNTDQHADSFNHVEMFQINVVVSPRDCATCHPAEAEQYSGSKKAHAVDNLLSNPVYLALSDTAIGPKTLQEDRIVIGAPTEHTRGRTCFGCHGTRVTVTGTHTVESDYGELELPVLAGWPNQGVGRINPDGSRGACTSCHARHRFSLEVARQPYTCSQCHLKPDVPAFNVYMESKHGNLFETHRNSWNWDAVPWVVGRDFQAPTCAVCHNALVVTPGGETVAERSHDFGARLWVRIFGLIYSHPQPIQGDTHRIRNADGLPLPVTFGGEPAREYLIDPEEQARRKGGMTRVCRACHSTDWAEAFFRGMDTELAAADGMVRTATQLIQRAWDEHQADPTNPFDELAEQIWVREWLFYASSVRYAAAMSGPDYATFEEGWWELTENLNELHHHVIGEQHGK